MLKRSKVRALMASVCRSISMLDIYAKTFVIEVVWLFRWWTETPSNITAVFEVRQSQFIDVGPFCTENVVILC